MKGDYKLMDLIVFCVTIEASIIEFKHSLQNMRAMKTHITRKNLLISIKEISSFIFQDSAYFNFCLMELKSLGELLILF